MASTEQTRALQEWARQELGVDSRDSRESRVAFLRCVREQNWLPQDGVPCALDVLEGRKPRDDAPGVEVSRWKIDKLLRDDVESFARRFFAMTPRERETEFVALTNRCRDNPFLMGRLNAFEKFLDEPHDTIAADDERRQLTSMLRELFVLRPAARSQRRYELLVRMSAKMQLWQGAARALKERRPELASLDPIFFKRLTDSGVPGRERPTAHTKSHGARIPHLLAKETPPRRTDSTNTGKNLGRAPLLGIPVGIVIFALWRILLATNSREPAPIPLPAPEIKAPVPIVLPRPAPQPDPQPPPKFVIPPPVRSNPARP